MKTKIFILSFLVSIFALDINSQVVISYQTSFINSFENAKKRTPATFKLKKGQTKDYNFYVFPHKEYLLTFKVPKDIKYWGFRILNENGEVLFDNALAGNTNSAVIYSDETQKITVRLTLQPPKFAKQSKKRYEIKLKIAYRSNLIST